jgi:hypothetical protein
MHHPWAGDQHVTTRECPVVLTLKLPSSQTSGTCDKRYFVGRREVLSLGTSLAYEADTVATGASDPLR